MTSRSITLNSSISPLVDSVLSFLKDSWEKSSLKAGIFIGITLPEVRKRSLLIEKNLRLMLPQIDEPSLLEKMFDDNEDLLEKLSCIQEKFSSANGFWIFSYSTNKNLEDIEGSILRMMRMILIRQAQLNPENSMLDLEEYFAVPISR